jgi:DNA mismatch repair protein MutL
MASHIRLLDESVVNKIAAGEVIERPASVLKELIENALDANSTSIKVDVESGGKKLIRVVDNGTGMSYEDAFLSLERHATSKLRSEKELFEVNSLGFRGEALASIAAVSRLRLVTCEGGSDPGTEIIVEGGILRKSGEIGAGRGTLVEVRNLFFNVPVRRKFLKSPDIEAGYNFELVTRYALAFPSVAFYYAEDGKKRIEAPPASTSLERINSLFSQDVCRNLAEVRHGCGNATVSGYIGRPPFARSNMRSVLTFVNGRVVRDRLLQAAVGRAFSNLLERGRYPFAVLFIELPFDQVDVNVHPQKIEVRFLDSKNIFDLIVDGLHGALIQSSGDIRQKSPEDPSSHTATMLGNADEPTPRWGRETFTDSFLSRSLGEETVQGMTFANQGPDKRLSDFSILGKLPNSFVVLFDNDSLIILDQHAAHERILFERLTRVESESEMAECQQLLTPMVLEFSPLEMSRIRNFIELFNKVGFMIEEFGGNDLLIRGIPVWLPQSETRNFFDEILNLVTLTGAVGSSTVMRDEILKSMACKAAIKTNWDIRQEEIRALLDDLDRGNCPNVCPHGRPFLVRIPFSEIRKKMGRKS